MGTQCQILVTSSIPGAGLPSAALKDDRNLRGLPISLRVLQSVAGSGRSELEIFYICVYILYNLCIFNIIIHLYTNVNKYVYVYVCIKSCSPLTLIPFMQGNVLDIIAFI